SCSDEVRARADQGCSNVGPQGCGSEHRSRLVRRRQGDVRAGQLSKHEVKKSPAATPGFSLQRFDAMEVSVRRDDAALTDLSGEWLALWRRDPAASPFHTPQYARAAWETELGADRSLAVIEIRRDGALEGLATATVDVDQTLRFLGNEAVT